MAEDCLWGLTSQAVSCPSCLTCAAGVGGDKGHRAVFQAPSFALSLDVSWESRVQSEFRFLEAMGRPDLGSTPSCFIISTMTQGGKEQSVS